MKVGRGSESLSEINVTPFVDVMLVLLIIFMVTAPLIQAGVDVNLPETTAKGLRSPEDPTILTVTKEGEIFFGKDKQVPFEKLQGFVAALRENKGLEEIYLKADKDVSYGLVVKVMAEVKAAGIDRLGMITIPET
ncbi:MAG: protein TolR [Myxococcota bacterium]